MQGVPCARGLWREHADRPRPGARNGTRPAAPASAELVSLWRVRTSAGPFRFLRPRAEGPPRPPDSGLQTAGQVSVVSAAGLLAFIPRRQKPVLVERTPGSRSAKREGSGSFLKPLLEFPSGCGWGWTHGSTAASALVDSFFPSPHGTLGCAAPHFAPPLGPPWGVAEECHARRR